MQAVEYIVVRVFASRAEPYQMKYKSRAWYSFGVKGGGEIPILSQKK